MGFNSQVSKWRAHVERELNALGVPLPSSHVLAIIARESNGKAGVINPRSGASGLLQVMPIALRDYNQHHSEKYTMSQLRSEDDHSAAIQIRVGSWILAQFVKSAYRYLKNRLGSVALDDLIRVADTFYAAGPGTARGYLNQIRRPTWAAIKAKFPAWDRVGPAEKVWQRANDDGATWDLPSIDRWLEGQIQNDKIKTAGGAIIGLLIVAAAWFLYSKGNGK